MSGRLVRAGALLSGAGAVHALVNARLLRRPVANPPRQRPVSVLIPARDEATTIARCVRAAVAQDDLLEVVVLDDGSVDGTAELAQDAGARVVQGAPPPPGWLGKPWACAQLVVAADPASDVLVFVDADVVLEPGALRSALDLLYRSALDLACPFPRQEAVGTSERLVQPLLQWSWLATLPLRLAESSRRPSLTAACGQFVVVRRSALDACGGFATVRDAVLDDIALARAVKSAGGRASVVDGTELASVRMYSGWEQVRDGYGKSLWAAFGSPAGALTVVAALVGVYVIPAAAALRGSRAGALAYAAAVVSRVVAARATGGRVWPDALAHPVSILVLGRVTLHSVLAHRRGRLTWKGRPVDAGPGPRAHRRRSSPAGAVCQDWRP